MDGSECGIVAAGLTRLTACECTVQWRCFIHELKPPHCLFRCAFVRRRIKLLGYLISGGLVLYYTRFALIVLRVIADSFENTF